jgi:exodeoxyribonuclease VII large subunit
MMGWTRSAEHAPRVLKVSELNRVARFSLEERFPDVWVEGELVDVSRPASGHVYFTLCDTESPAQVRGVMYRSDVQRARARLENGVRVRLRCSLTLYEPRGSFQVLARVALPAGEGDRAAELLRVKEALAKDGLFDPSKKRALPRFPRVIGVVTSRDGAAIHDVIRVASRRLGVRIVLVHCQVQGAEAPLSILRALRMVQLVPALDVVIIARGGGASEDLSAFDDERVARAVAACPVPTVSGVGHEVDVTMVDLVADARAATPSNAAEIAVPEAAQLRAELESKERALARALDQQIAQERLRIERAVRKLIDPRRRLAAKGHALSALHAALERAVARRLGEEHRALDRLRARLAVHEPRARLLHDREKLRALEERLVRSMEGVLESRRRVLLGDERALRGCGPDIARRGRSELGHLVSKLDALSPLGILARGYAIAIHEPTRKALVCADDAKPGDRIAIRVHEGSLDAVVERVHALGKGE